MKATGSKLGLVQEVTDHKTGMLGEVYYDYERSMYAVFINGVFTSEHAVEEEAMYEMNEQLDQMEL